MANKPLPKKEFVQSLIEEIRKFSTTNVLFNEGIAAKLQLNATDLKCRDLLNQTGPITAGQLAKLTNLTTGAITGVIDRLEKEELVKRVPDPEDRRRVIIQPLTHRNEEIRQLFNPLRTSLSQMFEKYRDEDLNVFLNILNELNALFPEELKKLMREE
ncbi:MarR family winged helix-turn-helix transcriptional regulator [Peribacillus alkalitolerans]|uniref:MarR family winged helix-turn-helix transcriptional regulator n=1 Tax=Peribacillus alkalitolerans TaxID=1550385 RepID=UPI0013D4CDB5|nr:MarR family transcriptional regulator [Peribacillus alkalitolerans]